MKPLWTRSFLLAFAANFFMAFAFYLLMPTLPLYLTEQLQISKSMAGVILSVYVIAALVMRPFSGFLIDKFPRKVLYLTSFALFVALAHQHSRPEDVQRLEPERGHRFLGLAFGLQVEAGPLWVRSCARNQHQARCAGLAPQSREAFAIFEIHAPERLAAACRLHRRAEAAEQVRCPREVRALQLVVVHQALLQVESVDAQRPSGQCDDVVVEGVLQQDVQQVLANQPRRPSHHGDVFWHMSSG